MIPVEKALDALGRDNSEIADTLFRLGITGIPGSMTECPVARYLNRCFPGSRFSVDGADIWDRNAVMPEVITPAAVTAFVMVFDHNGAPELDDSVPTFDDSVMPELCAVS